jgi:ribosome-associated protein
MADEPVRDPIADPVIELQDWMKLHQWVSSGGEAKVVIQGGEVRLNGEVETRRRKKLRTGDVVEFDGRKETVQVLPPPA